MKKLILIALSVLLPIVALATDPDSFKKGYQWGEHIILNSHSNNEHPLVAGMPSYLIPRLARTFYNSYCPSADLDSFIAGFYQAYEDYGKVMPMDDPATRPPAPPAPKAPDGSPILPGGGRGLRTGVSDIYSQAGVRAAAPTPTPRASAPVPTPTPSTLLDIDNMTVGHDSGKNYGQRHPKATPDQVRELATKFADLEGYPTEGQARNSFIEGWNDGYHDGAGIPEE
jgi:hypothetical protein